MQVVHDRRMPLQVPVEQRAHAHLRVVDVAVVVVEDVLAPIRRPADAIALVGDLGHVAQIPLDVAIAAIRIRGRRDRDDDLVADLLDQR